MAKAVAIIPARGGSKRIPGKNIRGFAGRPMIAWPIAACAASGLFSQIVVSTDDDAIADVARMEGAEVPFERAADLSDDHAGTTAVVRDAVQRLGLASETPVACVYATAVFAQAGDLAAGLKKLEGGVRWVLSVGAHRSPIQRAYRRDGDLMTPFDVKAMPMRSQDLEPAFFDAGQFYWAKAGTWVDASAAIWDGAAGVELPATRVCDIDTEEDWALAELMFRAGQ